MATLTSTGRFAAGEACADNDIFYGPYSSVSAAHSALLEAEQNVVGRTVGIQAGNNIEEYWYQGGTTEQHLVKKQADVDTSTLATKTELQQGLAGKQDTIGDLSDIRSGAEAGSTAVQPVSLNDYVKKSQTAGLLKNDGSVDTQTAGKAASALQPVAGAEENNFASFDTNHGLQDSGKKAVDFATASQGAKADSSVQNITRGGVTLTKEDGVVDIPEEIQTVVATPVAPGGSPSATLSNGTLTLGLVSGSDGHNPNLGTLVTSDSGATFTPALPSAPSVASDYIVVVDKTDPNNVTSTIWTWDTTLATPAWASTGRDANMAYFGSGELISDVNITQDPMTGGEGNVPSSNALKEVATKVYDVTRNTTSGDNETVKITKDNGDVIVEVTETTTTLNTDVEIGGDSSIDGDATIGGNLNVEGNFEVKDLSLESIEFVDSNGTHVSEATTSMTSNDKEEVKFCNDVGTEEYAKVDSDGVTAKGFFRQDGTPVGGQPYTIIVDPSGKGDYTSVADALKNAGDTPERHVIIIIEEGEYEMPAKLISEQASIPFNLPYAEKNRNLTLKGVNRNQCVLRNNMGYYGKPNDNSHRTDCATLRLSGNVVIENLTIISTDTDWNEYYGTDPDYPIPDSTGTQKPKAAYCIHFDMDRSEGDVMVVRNCTLKNTHGSCIGFGLRLNSTIRIEDCYLESNFDLNDTLASGAGYGVIWGHMASGQDYAGQRLEVYRNEIRNVHGSMAIDVRAAGTVSTPNNLSVTACIIGNAAETTNMNNAFHWEPASYTAYFHIDPMSFGNQFNLQ